MPKVSVIMGAYNGANRIKKSVNSILNQTFKDFELIICDDGSSDDTYNVLLELERFDNRIKILKNSVNKQLAYTLNKCIDVASGEYIARMDDDDYSHPDRFEKQVSFLDNNTQYSLVGTSINYFDNNGIWGTRNVCGEVTKLDILKGRTFVHPSVMIRSASLKAVGGYKDYIKRCQDIDLWVRLYTAGFYGYNLSDVLLDYYEDNKAIKKRKYEYRVCEFNIRKNAMKSFNIPFIYFPYVVKPLIAGLIPSKLIILYHRKHGR